MRWKYYVKMEKLTCCGVNWVELAQDQGGAVEHSDSCTRDLITSIYIVYSISEGIQYENVIKIYFSKIPLTGTVSM
jgi:hypothetical protein